MFSVLESPDPSRLPKLPKIIQIHPKSIVGCRLPVAGCRRSVFGRQPSVVGCRLSLSVVGCRLPVVGCWLLVIGYPERKELGYLRSNFHREGIHT